jgi:hypothetical protein
LLLVVAPNAVTNTAVEKKRNRTWHLFHNHSPFPIALKR